MQMHDVLHGFGDPGTRTVVALAEALGVTVARLMRGATEKVPNASLLTAKDLAKLSPVRRAFVDMAHQAMVAGVMSDAECLAAMQEMVKRIDKRKAQKT